MECFLPGVKGSIVKCVLCPRPRDKGVSDTIIPIELQVALRRRARQAQMRQQGRRAGAGQSWPLALETVLGPCRAVAVFLGPHGMESWPLREKWLALERRTRPQVFPVIPVLLSGGEPAPEFLSAQHPGGTCAPIPTTRWHWSWSCCSSPRKVSRRDRTLRPGSGRPSPQSARTGA